MEVRSLACRNGLSDWSTVDFQKLVWTDECAFNIRGFAGSTSVMRLPREEYLEECLVPKFRNLMLSWCEVVFTACS